MVYIFSALSISFSVLPKVEPFIPTFDIASEYRQLAFRCKTTMPSKYHRYVFDITWYINNHEIVTKNKLPYNNLTTDGVLLRNDWNSDPNGPKVLGFWVNYYIYLIYILFIYFNWLFYYHDYFYFSNYSGRYYGHWT